MISRMIVRNATATHHFVLVNQIVNLERWEINKFIAREVRAIGSDCLRISLDVVVTSVRNYQF